MKLHDYQRVGVEHLQRNPQAGLFMQMGLGKTATTLSALTPDHLPALVTAPPRVAEHVWPSETALWRPDLTVAEALGPPSAREDALTSGADIVVIGRDSTLKDAIPHAHRFRTLIIDELSGFKSRGTRWKTARKIVNTPSIEHVWGLTGTPSPNGLLDLWAQVFLLDGGQRLYRHITKYRSRYFTPGRQLQSGVITEWLLQPGADKRIHAAIEDICLSMDTDGRIDLPPTTFNEVKVPLPASALKVYKDMKDVLVADLDVLGGEVHTAANAAVLSGKLSQISAGFMYHDDSPTYHVLHQEKVRAVQEIVDGTGSPVLVFYRFKAEREMLLQAIPTAVPIDEKDSVSRWNTGNVPVLLAHPASAGHGLNLQHGGHTVVWTSLPWSLEEWEQGNKRVARQGQKHPVVIHMLLSPKTVDGSIAARLQDKKSVQDALLDHLESPL